MRKPLSKLNALWEAMSSKGKDTSRYGVCRKFYPRYIKMLRADTKLIDLHFDIEQSALEPGSPDDVIQDPITGTLYFVGRVTIPLENDVIARVFLKYCLDGKEYWWSSVRGPRGKIFDKLFIEYFEEETTKEAR